MILSLCWVGLGWDRVNRMGWAGLIWIGLGWGDLIWIGLGWGDLGWTDLDWVGVG